MGYIRNMKEITYTRDTIKPLRRLPEKISRRIRSKIEAYAENPASQTNNVKALKERDGIRLRVGDWRVIVKDGEVLTILAIGPKGGIYD